MPFLRTRQWLKRVGFQWRKGMEIISLLYMLDLLCKVWMMLKFQQCSWSRNLCEHSSDFTAQLPALEHAWNVRLWCWFSRVSVACVWGMAPSSRALVLGPNWHAWRIDTTAERSAHAPVQATELRSHWSVHKGSHFKSSAETSTVFRVWAESQSSTAIEWLK